jgi:capsular polysaccharide biosynthesis protein
MQVEILKSLLSQVPVLLVSLAGLIVALRLRRKAPTASMWAVAAFGLGIVTCALPGIGPVKALAAVLRAVTYVLLLIGVYAGRTSPSAMPTGSPEPIWQNVESTLRARPGLFAVSFALFFSVFLVVVITAILVTFILPESYSSIARIRIVLRPDATNPAGATGPKGALSIYDAHFIQTEYEVIQSEGVLGKVIGDLDLNKEWGKRYTNGERLKTSETMALLRARMDLRPVRNTSVIQICSYSEKPEEAAKVANAIAEAYRDHFNSPESATSGMSSGPRVEILDHAVPGFRPVRPNKRLNIAIGVLMGLVLGLLAGAGGWWVGLQAKKKPGANPQS